MISPQPPADVPGILTAVGHSDRAEAGGVQVRREPQRIRGGEHGRDEDSVHDEHPTDLFERATGALGLGPDPKHSEGEYGVERRTTERDLGGVALDRSDPAVIRMSQHTMRQIEADDATSSMPDVREVLAEEARSATQVEHAPIPQPRCELVTPRMRHGVEFQALKRPESVVISVRRPIVSGAQGARAGILRHRVDVHAEGSIPQRRIAPPASSPRIPYARPTGQKSFLQFSFSGVEKSRQSRMFQ